MRDPNQDVVKCDIGENRQVDTQSEDPIRYRDAIIKRVSNGFIVLVGCKTLVAKTWDEVSEGLESYWDNPKEAERRYCG